MECGEVYVTETAGLHTTNVRDIHSIDVLGDTVRIFTVDIIRHPNGSTERRVNNDIIIAMADLVKCIGKVLAVTKGPDALPIRQIMLHLGEKGH